MTTTPIRLTANRYVSYTDNYAKVPMLALVYPTVPDYHPDMAALDCLAEVLGQGRNSVLYQQLVKKQLALQASAFSQLSELAGEFSFRFTPMQGKTLADMETLFRAALDSFEKRGVTDEDVAKFKGSIESSMINNLQSVEGKVSQLAEFQTFAGNPNKISELLKMYASVTKEDVLRVYHTYIKGKGAVVLSVVPKGQESLLAATTNYRIDSSNYKAPDYGYAGLTYSKPADNFDRKKLPALGAVPTVAVPKFWRKDLPNGARVIGAQNTEVPVVTFTLFIPGGHLASANNLGKAGLASFFTSMMTEDTKNFTAESIALQLQKLGSTINITSGVDGVTYRVQALKKNFGPTMTILADRLLNPRFSEESFTRLKKQAMESFKLRKSQPAAIADAVFARLNYGPNHILGLPQGGTEETVGSLTLQDIQDYYNNYMTTQDARVVVVGDITQQELLPALAFLNKLPKKKITLPKVDAAPAVDKTKVYLVDVPKAAQSEFRLGYATGLKYDATGDYYKAMVVNYPLGGSFLSRLNQNLRETKGWTYGASSGFAGDQYSGDFRFRSGIRASVSDSALAEVMRELNDYAIKGPKADEVEFVKSAIAQSDALRYETGLQKAAFISRILEYNLPANYTETQARILKGLTAEQMKAVTAKYLRPDQMNLLLVGDKAAIQEGVKKLGYEVVELDVNGNKVEKKVF